MSVINKNIALLETHIMSLNKCEVCLNSDDYDTIIHEAEEIIKIAHFLKSYKELDKEREKSVKETVMEYLNKNNTYDGTLIKCIGYCFED